MNAPNKNWLEWGVFLVSLVLLSGVVGYLVYDAVTIGSQPPTIQVELGEVIVRGEQYMLPVTVRNVGDRTAEDVIVEIALLSGAEELETAEFTAVFVARQSTANGWAVFTIDPATADEIEARVLGFQQP